MVWGGRDEGYTGLGAAHEGDVGGDLLARELAALAGLSTLGDLDLDLVGVHEEVGGHAEAARRHLLDAGRGEVAVLEALEVGEDLGAPFGVHVGQRLPADRVLAALARVGLAADAVHGDGDRLVGLAGDGAERHAAGAEALHDLLDGLDLLDGDGLAARLNLEHVAEDVHRGVAEVLHVGLVRLVLLVVAAEADRLVEELGHLLVVGVVLEAGTRLNEAEVLELLVVLLGEALGPELLRLALEVVEGHAADARNRPGEALVHDVAAEAVHLEDLGAVVAREEGDAHLGEDLLQALLKAALVVALGVGDRDVGELAALDEVLRAGRRPPLAHDLVRHVGADGMGAVPDQDGHVVRRHAGGRVGDDRRVRAQALADEVVVDGADGEEHRDGGLLRKSGGRKG